VEEFESSRFIRISKGSTYVGFSRVTSLVCSTLGGSMSSFSRVLLAFIFWRISQYHELCEVVLWNDH